MSTTSPEPLSSVDRLLLGIENIPWSILYRAAIGWSLMPVYDRLIGDIASVKLVGFFFLVLVSLRIAPGLLRRVLPFSRAVKNEWAVRRAISKRYDSYQWQKLFGLGLGWLGYLLTSGTARNVPMILAAGCLVSGAIGLFFWYRTNKIIEAQAAVAAASA
jgi:hypothetical protein